MEYAEGVAGAGVPRPKGLQAAPDMANSLFPCDPCIPWLRAQRGLASASQGIFANSGPPVRPPPGHALCASSGSGVYGFAGQARE